jgi:hypothetical protein
MRLEFIAYAPMPKLAKLSGCESQGSVLGKLLAGPFVPALTADREFG